MSPFSTKAIGPPAAASGDTWPMHAPRVAPLNRPSVIRQTLSPKSAAHDVSGGSEHLLHARPAARAFVSNHHDVAGFDLAFEDSRSGGFFALEDHCRAAELMHVRVHSAGFQHGTVGSKIPKQYGQTALLAVGIAQRTNDVGYLARSRRQCSRPSVFPVTVMQSRFSVPGFPARVLRIALIPPAR